MKFTCVSCRTEDNNGTLRNGLLTCTKCEEKNGILMKTTNCSECKGKKNCREWKYYPKTDSLVTHCSECNRDCYFSFSYVLFQKLIMMNMCPNCSELKCKETYSNDAFQLGKYVCFRKCLSCSYEQEFRNMDLPYFSEILYKIIHLWTDQHQS